MTIYYGIVKGNTVILPDEAHLEDGTPVEVRVVSQSQPDDPRAEAAFMQQLLARGIITAIRHPQPYAPDEDRRPIPVDGEPLSELMIEERRYVAV